MARGNAAAVAAFLLAGFAASCGQAGPDFEFFRGKTVTIVVPHGPGGMDTYARAIAPFLQEYLPGSRFEVVDVPEAGGIEGRNRVFEAPPDGLTLGFTTTAGSLLTEWAGQPGVRYRTAGFTLIGRLDAEAQMLVVSPRTGWTRLSDLQDAATVRLGFAGISSDDYYVAMIAANLLGIHATARTDFGGIAAASLACVKGEVDAILFSTSSVIEQVRSGTLVPIAVFAKDRVALLPDVPSVFDSLPAGNHDAMASLVDLYALARTLFASPGVPEARLRALREAMDRTAADPDFLDAMAAVKRPVNYMSGAAATELLDASLAGEAVIRPLVDALAKGSY